MRAVRCERECACVRVLVLVPGLGSSVGLIVEERGSVCVCLSPVPGHACWSSLLLWLLLLLLLLLPPVAMRAAPARAPACLPACLLDAAAAPGSPYAYSRQCGVLASLPCPAAILTREPAVWRMRGGWLAAGATLLALMLWRERGSLAGPGLLGTTCWRRPGRCDLDCGRWPESARNWLAGRRAGAGRSAAGGRADALYARLLASALAVSPCAAQRAAHLSQSQPAVACTAGWARAQRGSKQAGGHARLEGDLRKCQTARPADLARDLRALCPCPVSAVGFLRPPAGGECSEQALACSECTSSSTVPGLRTASR